MKFEFSGYIFEKISSFIRVLTMGAELFHADGRTDMTNIITCLMSVVEYES
jgi:hypothetical protein